MKPEAALPLEEIDAIVAKNFSSSPDRAEITQAVINTVLSMLNAKLADNAETKGLFQAGVAQGKIVAAPCLELGACIQQHVHKAGCPTEEIKEAIRQEYLRKTACAQAVLQATLAEAKDKFYTPQNPADFTF
jgi:hypothetical protein